MNNPFHQPFFPRAIFPTLISKTLVSVRLVNTVICDSADGSGCSTWWLEYDGHAVEFCPGCGRRNKNGNIIVNSEEAPIVVGLTDRYALVIGDEVEIG